MNEFEVLPTSADSITQSFDRIAKELFTNYKLLVNDSEYRLLDIEFYYYDDKVFKDVYAHKHIAQLQYGKWYFHGSGLDLTIGNGVNHGGILIRAIAKISSEFTPDKHFIEKEIHGSLNVVTEIGSKFQGVFSDELNKFKLCDVSSELMGAFMPIPKHVIRTRRIGLNPDKDESEGKQFYNGKYRYVVFPDLKLKDKTQIAKDMQEQFPDMTLEEINHALGSKFLS